MGMSLVEKEDAWGRRSRRTKDHHGGEGEIPGPGRPPGIRQSRSRGPRGPNTRDRRCRSEMRAGDPGERLGAGPGPVRTCVGEAKVKDICPGAAAGAGAAAASA